MEKILPAETLKKFYCAFRDADPTHALIQCVDIMSDDQVQLCVCVCVCVCVRVYPPRVVSTPLAVSLALPTGSRTAWLQVDTHWCALWANTSGTPC